MFIKLGQVASTRSDLLPRAVIAELTQLQTAVPPAAPDEIREVVEEELGRPVEEVFADLRLDAARRRLDRSGPPGHARLGRGRRGQGAAAATSPTS